MENAWESDFLSKLFRMGFSIWARISLGFMGKSYQKGVGWENIHPNAKLEYDNF